MGKAMSGPDYWQQQELEQQQQQTETLLNESTKQNVNYYDDLGRLWNRQVCINAQPRPCTNSTDSSSTEATAF
jgi:hypothetical protein